MYEQHENTISLANRAKYFFLFNFLQKLGNDASAISTGKCEFIWGVPY